MSCPPEREERSRTSRDLAARRVSQVALWGIPVMAILLSGWMGVAVRWVWPLAFASMGGACILNAARCRRLHCFFTGPIFLVAALLAGLHGWGVLSLGPDGYEWIANGAFLGVLILGCLPELLFGKYLGRRDVGGSSEVEEGSP